MEEKLILCFSGSMKNPEIVRDMKRFQTIAELEGHLTVAPTFLGNLVKEETELKYVDLLSTHTLKTLMQLHKKKITLCDVLVVFDYENRIGPSTQQETIFAQEDDKIIRWMSEICPNRTGEEFRYFLNHILETEKNQ